MSEQSVYVRPGDRQEEKVRNLEKDLVKIRREMETIRKRLGKLETSGKKKPGPQPKKEDEGKS